MATKKLLSIALILTLVFSLAATALAAESAGVYLEKVKDAWYIVVENGYVGTVTYKDNIETYTYDVNGNGRYPIGLQRNFTGGLELVGTYETTPPGPTIIGTLTVTITKFDGYTASASFLANQKNQQGPKANYITATIEEKYTVITKVFDVWSDGHKTLKSETTSSVSKTYSGTSNALPNGSESNLVPTFEGGLGGYKLVVSYNGNGNKFTWGIYSAPERKTEVRREFTRI